MRQRADNIWWHCSFAYEEAPLMNIPPACSENCSNTARKGTKLPATTKYNLQWRLCGQTEQGGHTLFLKKSFDLPASLILLTMKQPRHGISMEPRKSSALRDGVQVSGNSSVPFLCKCPMHKCQSPIAPTKKSEWGPVEQGRTMLRMELLQNRTNSLHTQAMFYVHPLLPSPNCNWENIPVG